MTEPASGAAGLSLLGMLILALGPVAGPYALIVGAAMAGALWPLSTMENMTRRAGAAFLLRIVLTAVILTGAGAVALEKYLNIPIGHGYAVVALLVGAMGNGWRPVLDALRQGLVSILGRKNDSDRP